MGFPKQQYWSGLPCPSPGDLPNPRIKPSSLWSPALAGRFFITEPTVKFQDTKFVLICYSRYRQLIHHHNQATCFTPPAMPCALSTTWWAGHLITVKSFPQTHHRSQIMKRHQTQMGTFQKVLQVYSSKHSRSWKTRETEKLPQTCRASEDKMSKCNIASLAGSWSWERTFVENLMKCE